MWEKQSRGMIIKQKESHRSVMVGKMTRTVENFLRYVRIDTRSEEACESTPSTAGQHALARLLMEELTKLGAEELVYDREHCYVYATIPATSGCEKAPVLGFISHMDTSPAVSGCDVKPRIVEHYEGGDILLNQEHNIVMRTEEFPELANFAYTVDGGGLGELEYENFNAAGARLIVHGRNVHPGSAKGKMKNAILIAQEFQSLLPVEQNPMYTEGYEGFFHLDSMKGTVEEACAEYIIRDHDKELFEQKKVCFMSCAAFLNEKYGEGTISVDMQDSYYNMREVIEPHMHLIENAKQVMLELGIEPLVSPIRGGTDGARLSFMGLPCPNLCTGGENYHSRYEYACVQSMEKVTQLLILLAERYADREKLLE